MYDPVGDNKVFSLYCQQKATQRSAAVYIASSTMADRCILILYVKTVVAFLK